ncbi:MAG: hypothetical protein AB1772_11740 [Candidatus Zixiibacteriota bacterium]
MRIHTLTGLFLVVALTTAGLFAQQKQDESKNATPTITKPEHVDISGTLVCLGCSLKKSEGARSACSVYGHEHALKTDAGQYVNFLENQYSADLIKGDKYANKKLSIHGILHSSANLVDVESFTVDGSMVTWCDGHKAMDLCGSAASKK